MAGGARRSAVGARALVGALALAATACEQKQIPVVDPTGADDFGLADVTTAAREMAAAPTSPAAYRKLAVRIEELRPRFNDRVAMHAEVELAFLAIGPLAASLASPPIGQLETLATTVWPTAFRVEPNAGETPRAYLERLCAGPLVGECKYVVPEAWPEVMTAKVWRRMKLRAREVYGDCLPCQRDETFRRVLEDYDRHDTAWQARVEVIGDKVEPAWWPRGGAHARPWSDAPLLELAGDTVELAGEALPSETWRRQLRERRRGARVLGVHLRPRQEVRILRSALRDAAAAGWDEVALQVRDGLYPYPLREYRLSTRTRGERAAAVRDVDTIQVLVQALDVAAARVAKRDGAHPLLTL